MEKKILVATLYLKDGQPVKNNTDFSVLGDLYEYAKMYDDSGIDKLYVFDLSDDDDEHEENLRAIRQLNRLIDIPTCGGGNIRRMEDVKKLIYAGCKQIMLNASKNGCLELAKEAADRYGKDRMLVSVKNVDFIFKHQQEMDDLFHEVLVMDDSVLDAVDNLSHTPYVVYYNGSDFADVYSLLERENSRGICGPMFDDVSTDIMLFKTNLGEAGLWMDNFKPEIQWAQLKKNSDGMVPCIVQDYRTNEVLMLAYMNEEAYYTTLSSGKMTYYSRSRNELWTKGLTSGHIQYVKSLTADCDFDTILAKVSQVGVACHTGSMSCFFNEVVKKEYIERNPLKVLETRYDTILQRRYEPKEGSYINEIFDKGSDEILKKLGEEFTEVIIAAKNPDTAHIKYEIADLLYHLMIMMVDKNVTWDDITQELSQR
ncbi:MAG: bifunctional phosphoribosyl-AMP cyclohydrolase/phosphoribosyl-ATP diphosphatase HisIE [bacterium]|nr:bifunctional phosphoribosyl-AMP cyclohydrolase/phosphoribosyl-ATP diphosphatase HisIE [bacterium]